MSAPLKVLVVEDSADDAEIIVHELRRASYQRDEQIYETDRTQPATGP